MIGEDGLPHLLYLAILELLEGLHHGGQELVLAAGHCLILECQQARPLKQVVLILEGVLLVGVGDPLGLAFYLLDPLLGHLVLPVDEGHRE